MKILVFVIAMLASGVGLALWLGHYRWRARTAHLIARLEGQVSRSASSIYSAAALEGLPAPVKSYLGAVLRDGQPIARRMRLSQEGEFLLRPERNDWRPFTATQYFATNSPGFVWDARIRLAPGLTVRVQDALADGVGYMVASLMGLVPLVSMMGTPGIAAGALHRYLAEAVWNPSALLPSQGVVWSPIDEARARAKLTSAATTVSLEFRFGADGLVQSVFTRDRAREVNGQYVHTPWQGRFFDYEERGGVRIPLRGEVEWVLPEGPQLYWRGRIIDVSYD